MGQNMHMFLSITGKNNEKNSPNVEKKYITGINTNICSGYIDKHIQNPLAGIFFLKFALKNNEKVG